MSPSFFLKTTKASEPVTRGVDSQGARLDTAPHQAILYYSTQIYTCAVLYPVKNYLFEPLIQTVKLP